MTDSHFWKRSILNSLYGYTNLHWKLDATGQPTHRIIDKRRLSDFITHKPKPKRKKDAVKQTSLLFDEARSTLMKHYHSAKFNCVTIADSIGYFRNEN